MVVTFFDGAEPFKQINNIPLTDGPMWNLVKIGRVVSEKKTFKYYTTLYTYISQGQRQIPPHPLGQKFDCNYKQL